MDNQKRKILLDLAVTLDGFIEGKNGEIDWCIMEEEMNFKGFLDRIDTIFFGRRSYEAFIAYNPEESINEEDLMLLETTINKEHYVFSRTLKEDPASYKIISDNIADEVNSIRDLHLVDELRLSVHPVLLGEGKPLFSDLKERAELKLVKTNTYPSGVIQLIYHFKK